MVNKWIEPSVERYEAQKLLTNEIDKHLDELQKWCAPRSVNKGIDEQSSFIALVNMGDSIVNYIMHRMTQDGFRWEYCTLLWKITGDKIPKLPNESQGNLPRTMAHIILWWVDSEYYANDNVYFGLINEVIPPSSQTEE